MKNETLYNKTVDILVQAYFNDTLQHGNCAACAVGNIIGASLGISDENRYRYFFTTLGWERVFYTDQNHIQRIDKANYKGEARKQIDATGYTWRQLAKIEHAFECAKNGSMDDRMFNGLMAVIDALDIIHENKDATVTDDTKHKFIKA